MHIVPKTKGCPTDSLFNLNQLNLINQKLTRTVSPMICLKCYLKKFCVLQCNTLVCFKEFSAANILFFNNVNRFLIKFKLNVNVICLFQNFLNRAIQQQQSSGFFFGITQFVHYHTGSAGNKFFVCKQHINHFIAFNPAQLNH